MTREFIWAFRSLRKNPLFTTAVTAILALGIGANTAIFSIVDAVLLRPPAYEAASRLVRIEETSTKKTVNRIPAHDYLMWSARSDLFERTAGHLRDDVTISGAGEPDQVIARRTTPGLFSLLGVRAQLGRPLGDADHEALLSDRLWRRRFHADPDVIGRAMTISDESYMIVGVMPPEFEFPYADVEMWLPLRPAAGGTQGWVQGAVARIREGLSVSQVQGAMEIVARQLEREDPQGNAGLQIVVSSWRDDIGVKYEQTLVLILAAVGLVLLIACADVGSLLLSRAVQRQKEMAIRASLGAAFGRLLRQVLAESLALALAGSMAGIGVAYYTVHLLTRQIAAMPVEIPRYANGRPQQPPAGRADYLWLQDGDDAGCLRAPQAALERTQAARAGGRVWRRRRYAVVARQGWAESAGRTGEGAQARPAGNLLAHGARLHRRGRLFPRAGDRKLRQDCFRREAADADRSRRGIRTVPRRPRLIVNDAAEA